MYQNELILGLGVGGGAFPFSEEKRTRDGGGDVEGHGGSCNLDVK